MTVQENNNESKQELDHEGVAYERTNILEDMYTVTKYVVYVRDVCITYYNRVLIMCGTWKVTSKNKVRMG